MRNKILEHEISMAIAWGSPDRESIGYTHEMYSNLLRRVRHYIEYLEKVANVPEHKIIIDDI